MYYETLVLSVYVIDLQETLNLYGRQGFKAISIQYEGSHVDVILQRERENGDEEQFEALA